MQLGLVSCPNDGRTFEKVPLPSIYFNLALALTSEGLPILTSLYLRFYQVGIRVLKNCPQL